jgi:hypothetical protein
MISCHAITLNGDELKKKIDNLKIIGWREWVTLPELKIDKIKAKVDSGARTSSLHAFDMKIYRRGGVDYVRFRIHPDQKSTKKTIVCHAKVFEFRRVKSSNGMSELRPVILTEIQLMGEKYKTEMTLTNRDEMGFRMLLGRQSIKNKFLLHTGKSFFNKIHVKKGSK